MSSRLLPIAAVLLSTASARPSHSSRTVTMPLIYSGTDGNGKVSTDIEWGTPPQPAVLTVFDAGSSGFWVDQAHSYIDAINEFTGESCVYSVPQYFPVYHVNKSHTHTPLVPTTGDEQGFSYGNSKIIRASYFTNDTISWASTAGTPQYPSLHNIRVALADNTTTQTTGGQCDDGPGQTDVSIMGMAPGSFFRSNLLASGLTENLDWSVWFRSPASATPIKNFNGTALLGGPPPSSAYTGPMTDVPLNASGFASGFYYISIPTLSIAGHPIRRAETIPNSKEFSDLILLDSGTTQDMIPYNSTDMANAGVGLVNYNPPDGIIYFAYNGSCASIPHNLTFDYTFTGVSGEKSTVKVPIRNYAYGKVPDLPYEMCNLANVEPDNQGTTNFFGAPFFSAVALYFRDGRKTVGIAQGGL